MLLVQKSCGFVQLGASFHLKRIPRNAS